MVAAGAASFRWILQLHKYLPKSARFYKGLNFSINVCTLWWAELESGPLKLALMHSSSEIAVQKGYSSLLSFTVTNINNTMTKLMALGAEMDGPIKYEVHGKVHDSKQGQPFRSQVKSMHMEILQSPWLYELIAFHINLRERKGIMVKDFKLFEGCGIIFNDGRPSLSCELSHAVKLEIDLTCSVCLDTVFDPVCLTCGHIFSFMCACKSASVTIVDGLKASQATAKCPLCREARVYHGSLHLDELNILLSQSCPEYWEGKNGFKPIEQKGFD